MVYRAWSQAEHSQCRGLSDTPRMPWFVRDKEKGTATWRRSETAPNFAPAVIELSASGECLLFIAPDVHLAVNGTPVLNGVRVLQHRDEIASADAITYFSTEKLPEVVAFSGSPVKCGRCRSEIKEGSAAAMCVCGLWYHASDRACFEYGDAVCIACGRPTRLDGAGLWCPKEQ